MDEERQQAFDTTADRVEQLVEQVKTAKDSSEIVTLSMELKRAAEELRDIAREEKSAVAAS
jgi:hypothetical protein